MVSGFPLYWVWEPGCEILMFMWCLGPLFEEGLRAFWSLVLLGEVLM